MAGDASVHWYALKVFFNRVFEIEELLKKDLKESYIPCQTINVVSNGIRKTERQTIIPSLMFFRSTEQYANELQTALRGRIMVYTYFDENKKRQPAAISDHEMNMFILVTSAGDKGLEFFADDCPEYQVGERVRVIDGLFKGAEGCIKHNRRLTVSLKGVCMVATSFIPPCCLEKIE